MPIVSTDIPDHQDYITRPIVLEITREIIQFSGLPQDKIIYRGHASQAKHAGSTLDDVGTVSGFSDTANVQVTAEEDFQPDSLLTTGIMQRAKRTVFHDDESRVYLAPVRKDATISLEVVYTCGSAAEARDWRNRMQQNLERRMEVRSHKVAYKYPIPYEYVSALKSVHEMRESGYSPYGQTLGAYLKDNFSSNVAVSSKMNGQGSQFVVEETQHGIQGSFMFDEVPKESKDGSVFTISFTYLIRYEKPYAMIFDYPLVISNQAVRNDLMPRVNYNEKLPMDRSVVSNWFDGVVHVSEPTQSRVGGYSIPHFDDWTVPYAPRETGSVFRILITVDVTDTTLILNIGELGKYQLNEDIIELMRLYGPMLFEYAHCPVLVQFYEDNLNISPKDLEFDGVEFRVKNRTLDPRKCYHLRIALVTNLAMLSEPAIDLALTQGRAMQSIMLALEPTLITKNLMPKLYDGRLDEYEYRKAIEHIRSTALPYEVGGAGRVRIAFLTISTHRG